MSIAFTKPSPLGVDRYMLKQGVATAGQAPYAATVTNAAIVADMVEGPLRDAWLAVYVSAAAAKLALQDGAHGSVYMRSKAASATGAPLWSAIVGIDVNGLATLDLAGAIAGSPYVLELAYRHSTGR